MRLIGGWTEMENIFTFMIRRIWMINALRKTDM